MFLHMQSGNLVYWHFSSSVAEGMTQFRHSYYIHYSPEIPQVLTCIELITPLAIPESLPATLVTPCLTLSFTSSMSGAWGRNYDFGRIFHDLLIPACYCNSSDFASYPRQLQCRDWNTYPNWCCYSPGIWNFFFNAQMLQHLKSTSSGLRLARCWTLPQRTCRSWWTWRSRTYSRLRSH